MEDAEGVRDGTGRREDLAGFGVSTGHNVPVRYQPDRRVSLNEEGRCGGQICPLYALNHEQARQGKRIDRHKGSHNLLVPPHRSGAKLRPTDRPAQGRYLEASTPERGQTQR